jgi:hypothetical protein
MLEWNVVELAGGLHTYYDSTMLLASRSYYTALNLAHNRCLLLDLPVDLFAMRSGAFRLSETMPCGAIFGSVSVVKESTV